MGSPYAPPYIDHDWGLISSDWAPYPTSIRVVEIRRVVIGALRLNVIDTLPNERKMGNGQRDVAIIGRWFVGSEASGRYGLIFCASDL